jgi:maltose alpha-D-glucosyltransferase / alpha-amylase
VFELAPGALLAVVDVDRNSRYVVPIGEDGAGLQIAVEGDGTWRALAVSVAEGRTIPSLPRTAVATADAPAPVTAALVCRPAPGLRAIGAEDAGEVAGMPERPVGADQSNTSVVIGERLILKVFRHVEEGLNPDLELNAWLAEEMGFEAVPRLAGFVELVTADGAATVAMAQEFLPGAADAYEATAERLTAWILAPGEVTVEYATEEAAVLGALTAYLHAALAAGKGQPDFEPRDAGRDELRTWYSAATAQLQRAIDAVRGTQGDELRAMAPAIADELTVFEAIAGVPILTRVHGDYHLGQVLETPNGYRVIDFEGEPTRPLEERRRRNSPLRDVASMLRSIDHVGRSARRRAEARRGGVVESPGLDIEAWLSRARERFLEGYRRGLRERGAPIEVDVDLLRAFEFEKECYEFIYAATYLPDWLWAPLEGMRALVASSSPRG